MRTTSIYDFVISGTWEVEEDRSGQGRHAKSFHPRMCRAFAWHCIFVPYLELRRMIITKSTGSCSTKVRDDITTRYLHRLTLLGISQVLISCLSVGMAECNHYSASWLKTVEGLG